MPNPRLIQSDLKYLGAFRITPTNQAEGGTGFSYSIIKINNGGNSFFLSGLGPANTGINFAEFSIPALSSSTNVEDLNLTGAPIQNFSDFIPRIPFKTGTNNTRSIANINLINSKLYVTTLDPYLAGGVTPVENLFVVENPADLANSAVTGYITVQGNNYANGWMTPIPSEWQASLGGEYLMGNARRASVNARWSMGPSAYSFNIADLEAATAGDTVPTNQLMTFPLDNRMWRSLPDVNNWNYQGGHEFTDPDFPSWKLGTEPNTSPQNRNWRPSGVQHNDMWTEVSRGFYGFIPPNTNTYAVFGRIGGLRKGIAYKTFPINGGPQPASGEHPYDYADRDSYIWLFDLNDLAAHRAGQRESYEITPYYYGKLPLLFENETEDNLRLLIKSADYDYLNNKLYVVYGDTGNSPIVGVYELIFDRPESPTNVTGGLNMTWDAPTTRVDGTALQPSDIAGYEIKAEWGRRIYGNAEAFQTTGTSYTLPEKYAKCKISVAAFDTNGKYSDFVWNGVGPLPRVAPPTIGGIR